MTDSSGNAKSPVVWVIVGVLVAAVVGFALFGGPWGGWRHGMNGGHDMSPMGNSR